MCDAQTYCNLAEIARLQFELTPAFTEQKIFEVFDQSMHWLDVAQTRLIELAPELLPLVDQNRETLRCLCNVALLDYWRRESAAKEREAAKDYRTEVKQPEAV